MAGRFTQFMLFAGERGWLNMGWDRTPGDYDQVYGVRGLPDRGTGKMAVLNLDLVQFLPMGTGAVPRQQWRTTSKPAFALPTSYVSGMPTIAGSLISQPLFNPYQKK